MVFFFLVINLVQIWKFSQCCTSFLVTPQASESGSSMISYSADSHTLYGALYFFPSTPHSSTIPIYEWDTGKYLGTIPNVKEPLHVVGYMNELQVTIGESTFGGLKELETPNENDILDYGNMIWITLQRAKTAREAITVIDALIKLYGWHSEGESFSIADRNEVWIMEIIGKGEDEMGAVWVARKIKNGYVCAHANQARIRTFPLNDPDNCLYSDDLFDFALRKGYMKESDKREEFSFADTFNPLTFDGARFCEARVWSFFNQVSDGMREYLDHALGENLDNRLPLMVKVNRKLSEKDLFKYMRSHFEDTVLDMSIDIGSFPFHLPYRWRPLTWESNGLKYVNERAIATQQTGFSFISKTRPKEIPNQFGITYFGVDDTAMSVYFPVYNSITKIPYSWGENSGSLKEFNFNSAFWIFNMLSHFVYLRYDLIYPEVRDRIEELESEFIKLSEEVEKKAKEEYYRNMTQSIETLTNFSCTIGDNLFQTWKDYYGTLFKKYFDGDRRVWKEGEVFPEVFFDGYSKEMNALIAQQNGKKFLVPEENHPQSRNVFLILIIVLINVFILGSVLFILSQLGFVITKK